MKSYQNYDKDFFDIEIDKYLFVLDDHRYHVSMFVLSHVAHLRKNATPSNSSSKTQCITQKDIKEKQKMVIYI